MSDFDVPAESHSSNGQINDKAAAREQRLQALAQRRTPKKPGGAVSALADQFLLYTSWSIGKKMLPVLPDQVGGLVLRGTKAATGIRELREDGFDRPLLLDTEGYRRAAATEDEPFAFLQDEYSLFPPTLEQELQDQRDRGATVTLTPTGYLRAGDSDALRAAVAAASFLEDGDVIFSVPLDVAWFTNEHIDHLIAVLAKLSLPKAVFLGGQFDPMERYRDAVANLRLLVAEAGDVAVMRTDLTAFDAVSHGAFAASIGTGGSLRHVIPFGQFARSKHKDYSPSVLFSGLMSFYKGSTLHSGFADSRAPVCECQACNHRPLDTFLSNDDTDDAHRHSMCSWASWIDDLAVQPTLADRATWWRNRCAAAVAYAETLNTQLDQPDLFKPPETLQAWAGLPTWLSATEPVTRWRSRTR